MVYFARAYPTTTNPTKKKTMQPRLENDPKTRSYSTPTPPFPFPVSPPPIQRSLTLGPITAAFCIECLLSTSSLVAPGPRAPGAGDTPPDTDCDSTGIGGGWRLGPDLAV